ncbi:DUF3055 domain-containing protein [Aneurinibacillus terranovensis]|uniref:DUF3055 domain-containing protein n=1 Tax=Aneurinibacillus terranovensis TaxID=278991 RepID=UPI00040FA479|nr:DUF3055 domain-containing protein [Aneurinibacillus terranovensis]
MFERLYDETETTKVHFTGFVSETSRYDFGIVLTHQFFGKPLVICMQTGRSSLMCSEDVQNLELLKRKFLIQNDEEARELSLFLQDQLPSVSSGQQQY